MVASLVLCRNKGTNESKQREWQMSKRDFETFNEMSPNKTGGQTPNKLAHLATHKTHIDKC